MIDGIGSQPFSAVTLPPIKPAEISCREMVIDSSRRQFSKKRPEVEEAIALWHAVEVPKKTADAKATTTAPNGIKTEYQKPKASDVPKMVERVVEKPPYVKEEVKPRAVPPPVRTEQMPLEQQAPQTSRASEQKPYVQKHTHSSPTVPRKVASTQQPSSIETPKQYLEKPKVEQRTERTPKKEERVREPKKEYPLSTNAFTPKAVQGGNVGQSIEKTKSEKSLDARRDAEGCG
jgi:hypothetical protein